MRVRRVEDPQQLAEVGWDTLLGVEDGFQTRAWLEVQARIGADVAAHGAGPGDGPADAGLVVAWADERTPWLLARPDVLLRRAREGGAAGAAGAWAGSAEEVLPSLVCGGRHLGRTRPLRRDGAGPGDAPTAGSDEVAAAVTAVVEAAEREALDRGARSVCFPHVDERDAWLCDLLESRGYAWHHSEVLCWLDVPAGGWDAYLATMSQHRRRRVRLERRAVEEAGVRVRPVALGDAPLERLGELDAALLAKYGNASSPEGSTRSLTLLAEGLGDDALCMLAERDGDVVAFGVVVRSRARGREQWFGHRAGFDYEAQGDLPLYHEVLYYRVLELAAERGVPVLDAGVGSAHAKQARGCHASPQRSYLLPTSRRRSPA
jgi:hypothetical protein